MVKISIEDQIDAQAEAAAEAIAAAEAEARPPRHRPQVRTIKVLVEPYKTFEDLKGMTANLVYLLQPLPMVHIKLAGQPVPNGVLNYR
jgi:hypothetical protein